MLVFDLPRNTVEDEVAQHDSQKTAKMHISQNVEPLFDLQIKN